MTVSETGTLENLLQNSPPPMILLGGAKKIGLITKKTIRMGALSRHVINVPDVTIKAGFLISISEMVR